MSSELAISCKGVGKAFQLYLKRNDQLYQALFGRWKQFYHPHWVLRDVNFEVQRGETWSASSAAMAPARPRCCRLICGITQPSHGKSASPAGSRLSWRSAPASTSNLPDAKMP